MKQKGTGNVLPWLYRVRSYELKTFVALIVFPWIISESIGRIIDTAFLVHPCRCSSASSSVPEIDRHVCVSLIPLKGPSGGILGHEDARSNTNVIARTNAHSYTHPRSGGLRRGRHLFVRGSSSFLLVGEALSRLQAESGHFGRLLGSFSS